MSLHRINVSSMKFNHRAKYKKYEPYYKSPFRTLGDSVCRTSTDDVKPTRNTSPFTFTPVGGGV